MLKNKTKNMNFEINLFGISWIFYGENCINKLFWFWLIQKIPNLCCIVWFNRVEIAISFFTLIFHFPTKFDSILISNHLLRPQHYQMYENLEKYVFKMLKQTIWNVLIKPSSISFSFFFAMSSSSFNLKLNSFSLEISFQRIVCASLSSINCCLRIVFVCSKTFFNSWKSELLEPLDEVVCDFVSVIRL